MRSFLREAIDFGLGNPGLSISICGPHRQSALFTVNHTCSDYELENVIQYSRRDFILIAHMFNKKALELEPDKSAEPSQSLSRREPETPTSLSLVYSRAQAANTLGISEQTLHAYAENARYKLGALNTIHAVAAAAISRGLIVF